MFALALLCLSFAACGAKQYPMQITVVNRSTYPITDLRISLISEEDWGENRLETTLEEGESAGIDLGEYTASTFNSTGRTASLSTRTTIPVPLPFLKTAISSFSRRRI